MITLQRETLSQVADEIQVLIQQHYDEIALHKEAIPLDPDWNRYALAEEHGNLYAFTARSEGQLIGYSVFFVVPHIHYQSTLMATNDVLYLLPEHRHNALGVKLIKYSEQQLQLAGVRKITFHAKFSNGLRHLLTRLGYGDEEIVQGKII